MADLSLVFSDLYTEIEKFLGTYNSGSAATADVTDAKFIVNRAYARYCSYYDWSFLSQHKTLETNGVDYRYELPGEFSYLITPRITFAGNDAFPDVQQRSIIQIQSLRSETVYNSYPQLFALQAGNYHKETGQAWEIWLYPTPDAEYQLQYFCKINPQKLVDDADIPIGGAEFSDCLLTLCLAYAEQYKDERKAVHNEIVNEILGPAKMIDNKRRPSMLGNLGGGIVDINYSDIHHGNVLIST